MPLDIEQPEALLNYLRTNGRIGPNEQASIHTLGGGVSNRTVLVERANGEAWVIKQALRRLRVPVEWYSPPERIHREALGLVWLEQLTPAGTITPLVFEDEARHLLAMRAVRKPHEPWKAQLLEGRVDLRYVGQFGAILGTLQRNSSQRRAELPAQFNDRSFFETLRTEPYYIYVWTRLPETAAFYDRLIHETRTHRQVLVHGDYSPKNMLIHAGKLILIDHETIHFGDPAFDPGFALAHLLSKANHVAAKRDALLAAALRFWEAYCASLGSVPWASGLEARAVRHALGCLLARVAGRSTLAYLTTAECEDQQAAALAMIAHTPTSVAELVEEFGRLLTRRA